MLAYFPVSSFSHFLQQEILVQYHLGDKARVKGEDVVGSQLWGKFKGTWGRSENLLLWKDTPLILGAHSANTFSPLNIDTLRRPGLHPINIPVPDESSRYTRSGSRNASVCVCSTLQNRKSGLGGGFLQIIWRISFLCKIPGSALWPLFRFSNLEPLRKNEADILESYLFFSNVHNIVFHDQPLPKSFWVGGWCKESAKQSNFYSISMVTCKKKKTVSMGYRK